MYFLTDELFFPPVNQSDRHGLLAIGGDLSPARLLLAYRQGIFPWFNADEPILWWAPPKRMVVFPKEFKPSKSMRNIINRGVFQVTFNRDFQAVISNCQTVKRSGQDDTWITDGMMQAYCKLHEMGKAKSVEVWQNGELVGGLYGVDQGHVFCGESMFSKVSNASKVAFISLVDHLREGRYDLLDCQLHNDHLASLGAREISRGAYMQILHRE